jgi:hypothetical protein
MINSGALEFPVILLTDLVGRLRHSPFRRAHSAAEGERHGRRDFAVGGSHSQLEERLMFVALAVILLLAWALGLGVFHVAGGLIHLLIILAVISVIVHFARGRTAV